MTYQRSLIAAGALSLAVLAPAGGAMAADMPSYTPPPPMAVAPVWSWQGFYVGLFAGAAWGDVEATELFNVPTLTYYNGFGANYSLDGTGFFGGAQAGYN
jgi:outer membrane immunogenic protein